MCSVHLSDCTNQCQLQLEVHTWSIWAFLEFLLHKITIGHSFFTPWKDAVEWKCPRLDGLENLDWHGVGWGNCRSKVGGRFCELCIQAAKTAAWCVVLMINTQGESILHSVCFPVLHLQIRSMGVAWKKFSSFCFCLEFDRLNYCKHSLFLCLRNWMENSIVCCWTVLEIFWSNVC